jgi:hypothetical protein
MELYQVTDGHSLMERGYYIVSGKDKDDLITISDEIEKTFVLEK